VADHLRIASLAYKNKFAKTTSLANEKKFHSTLRVKKMITTSFACFRLIGQVQKKEVKLATVVFDHYRSALGVLFYTTERDSTPKGIVRRRFPPRAFAARHLSTPSARFAETTVRLYVHKYIKWFLLH
jgi:hypothetical protein